MENSLHSPLSNIEYFFAKMEVNLDLKIKILRTVKEKNHFLCNYSKMFSEKNPQRKLIFGFKFTKFAVIS